VQSWWESSQANPQMLVELKQQVPLAVLRHLGLAG
jgi:hypothetical protein